MELILDRLTKQYHNKIAVDRISLKLEKGVHRIIRSEWGRKNNAYENDLRCSKAGQRDSDT